MKKLVLVAAIAMVAMTSCKKEYSCSCTVTTTQYSNGVATTSAPVTTSAKTSKLKKSDAKSKCEASNGTTMTGDTQDGLKAVVSCEIK